MAVLCRQLAPGEPDQTYPIASHSADQTDLALLVAKAQGAEGKGWTVEWVDEHTFVATKERWGGVPCSRTFWIE